jgi:sugar lactone lactonase YvrE
METMMNTAVKRMIGSISIGVSLSVAGLMAQTTTPTTPAAPVLPTYTASTVVGSYNMTDTSSFAPVINPLAIASDSSGNIFFTDSFGNRIRRIDAVTGAITTVAGTGGYGYAATGYVAATPQNGSDGDGGPATAAYLTQPSGIAVDSSGNLYISDSYNATIRKVTASTGVISLFAGSAAGAASGFTGDGNLAYLARLRNPQLIAVDKNGVVYFADKENNRIRKITTDGIIHTIAGFGGDNTTTGGGYSGDFIPGTSSITTTTGTSTTLSATQNGQVPTVTSTAIATQVNPGYAVYARLGQPQGVAVDSFGNVYIADTANGRIRMVQVSDSNGNLLQQSNYPTIFPSASGGVLTDSTRVIVTVAGNTGSSPSSTATASNPLFINLSSPRGLAVDSKNNVYIADTGNNRILYLQNCLPAPAGATSSCVANIAPIYANTSPALSNPVAIALDPAGNLWVAEASYGATGNSAAGVANRIRKINSADGSSVIVDALQSGTINLARGIAFDAQGNMTVTDTGNQRIVKLPAAGGPATVVGGVSGASGISGVNPSLSGKPPVWGPDISTTAVYSKISSPWGGVYDSQGNFYFADRGNHRVKKIDASGNLTTVAGTGYQVTITSASSTTRIQNTVQTLNNGYYGDGGLAVAAQLNTPSAVAVDSLNNFLYIADTGNYAIRQVNLTTGFITTYAGIAPACVTTFPSQTAVSATGLADASTSPPCPTSSTGATFTQQGAAGDGLAATAAQLNSPEGVAVDSAGNVYIADTLNYVIRKIGYTSGIIDTIAGLMTSNGRGADTVPAVVSTIEHPVSVAVDGGGNVYWAQGCVGPGGSSSSTTGLNQFGTCETMAVRRLDAASGLISTITAGATSASLATGTFGGDGGASTKVLLTYPLAVAVDSTGNVYVSDSTNRIRKFSLPAPTAPSTGH